MLLMGKSTISMAMFNSFLYVYQAGYPIDGVNYPQSLATYSGWDDPSKFFGGAAPLLAV